MNSINIALSVAVVLLAFTAAALIVLHTHRKVRKEIEKANELIKQLEHIENHDNQRE